MTGCLEGSDLLRVSRDSIESFEKKISQIPKDSCDQFYEAASRLEAELLTSYKYVILFTNKEEELEDVAKWWSVMVKVCDEYAKCLHKLSTENPECGAEIYHDRILDLRNRCKRFHKMHA